MLRGPRSRRQTGQSPSTTTISLASVLRSNLLEIAQTNSFNDAEDLRDILLDRLTPAKR